MQIKRIALPLLAAFVSGVFPARTVLAANAGDVDTSFNASTDGYVNAVVIQSDGKILVGGSFAHVNGTAHANLARLNADGSLDAAFTATTDAAVAAMVLQPDGKLVIGGTFLQAAGTACHNYARLNTDGSIDPAFDTSFNASFSSGTAVTKLAYQSNSQLVIAGYEPNAASVTYPDYYLARLNADGSPNTSFPVILFGYYYTSVTPGRASPAWRRVAGGCRSTAQSRQPTGRATAVRHRKDPEPPPPPPPGILEGSVVVEAVTVQPDGKIIYSAGAPALTRLNADGTTDASFPSEDEGFYGPFTSVLLQPDGQIIASGGSFVRLNATDGSLDASFQAAGFTGNVLDIIEQPDGRIVASGSFIEVNATNRQNVARLAADGTLDTDFVPPASIDGTVSTMALQADGNLIIGGGFVRIGGVVHQGIARLYGNATAVPQIGSAPTATGQVGVPFSYQITAGNLPTSFAAGAVYSVAVGLDKPLPAGLSLNPATGLISGTPTREGDFVIAVEAINAAGADLKEIPLTIATAAGQVHPSFFTGEEPLSNGVYYLKFFYSGSQATNYFSYYSYLSDPNYLYHFDLGYEYVFDANDGHNGIYLYDFVSSDYFYTSPTFPFPYLYDFGLNSTVYYYGDPADPERYDTNGVRYFYVFSTGQTITK